MAVPRQLEIAEHAIQLNFIGVREIHFESGRLPSTIDFSGLDEPSFTVARSDYDASTKTIQVTTRVDVKSKGDSAFSLRVALVAQFRVDENSFPVARVHDWADRAAFYIIFPFLREEIFSLTTRVGMKPIFLPLLQIPTFKVEAPSGSRESLTPVQ